ncbi:MAG: hypothetical protein A4E28_02467 [Methanocella sp. PtaU1.Bin125]|nr:MAG: hypothetical protein A4E28_02467 [Methanocella sp. PtaU1.Bin125]
MNYNNAMQREKSINIITAYYGLRTDILSDFCTPNIKNCCYR